MSEVASSISIHDNRLMAYHVLAGERRIRLETVFEDQPGGEAVERTDVIFDGVFVYHFEGDTGATMGTILFDVAATSPAEVLAEDAPLFRRLKDYGWPCAYDTPEHLLEIIAARGVQAFAIHSSCGMTGWVWAERMTLVAVSGGAPALLGKGSDTERDG
jgi:hypothetical protein